METTKHPGWKNAVEIILKRFDKEGYGIVFSEKEILDMLELEKPSGTYAEYQQFDLEKLSQLNSLKKTLLEDANLCLDSAGNRSYMIMHPDDQINKTAQKYCKHARNKINRMATILTCVDNEALSMDGKQKQIDLLGRAAFIRAAMNKRKIIGGKNEKNMHKLWVSRKLEETEKR